MAEANSTRSDRVHPLITEVNQKLKQRFYQLSPRDRLALTLLTGFVALLMLIYGLILPAIHFHESARQNFQTQQELLQWLRQQQPAIAVLTAATPVNTPTSGKASNPLAIVNPLSLVNNSAKDFGLKISRLQPENNGSLRVWIDSASFASTLNWLHHLQSQGMTVKEITVDRQQDGMVSIRAVF